MTNSKDKSVVQMPRAASLAMQAHKAIHNPEDMAASANDAAREVEESAQKHYESAVNQPSTQLARMEYDAEMQLKSSIERRTALEATFNMRVAEMQKVIDAQVNTFNTSISNLEKQLEQVNASRQTYIERSHKMLEVVREKYKSEDENEAAIAEALRASLNVLRKTRS